MLFWNKLCVMRPASRSDVDSCRFSKEELSFRIYAVGCRFSPGHICAGARESLFRRLLNFLSYSRLQTAQHFRIAFPHAVRAFQALPAFEVQHAFDQVCLEEPNRIPLAPV